MKAQTKWVIAGGAVIAIITAVSAGYYFISSASAGPDPAKMSSEQVRTYVQSPDFNSMPRRERHEFFEKVMDARVTGYFNTPQENREEYLDRIIDDMQKYRPTNFGQRPRDPNRMRQWQQGRQNATADQRRLRREMRDPVKESMRREFFDALQSRAEARGTQMGPGPGRRGF